MGAAATQAPDRVRFGIDGLDDVLLGGLVRHNHVLLEGPAGSGKTTLALSFLYAGAMCREPHELLERHELECEPAHLQGVEPGLFVSFEMSPSKLLRDARGFGWELTPLMRQGALTAIEATPAFVLQDPRVEQGAFAHQLRALGIKRLVIDGLTPLRLAFERSALHARMSFRTFLQQLLGALARLGVTTIVTSESSAQPVDERYVFDTLLCVTSVDRGHASRRQRVLEVVKSRGQDFVEGRHTLRIEAGRGAVVYPRAQSRERRYTQRSELRELCEVCEVSELHSFGSPELDRLLGGGLYAGSITWLHGVAGSGKTVAGLQFLVAGARAGQAGLMVSLDEQPAQLIRNAKTLDFPIDALVESEQLSFLYDSPLDLELDVHFDCIVRLIERRNVRRVVFDSLARYETLNGQDVKGFLHALAAFCKSRGILVVCSYDSSARAGRSSLGDVHGAGWKGAQWVDNLVLLSYAELATGLRRAIVVPKARGRRSAQLMREYAIGSGGLTLSDADDAQTAAAFAGYLSLLSRPAAGANRRALEALESPLPPSAELQRTSATE